MDSYYQDRLYMPRRTKRFIRALSWLMVFGFLGGVMLLANDGTLAKGIHDWQKASATIFNSTHKTGEKS